MYADWCGPCRVLGPIFEKFAKQLESDGSNVGAYKFNIESDKELAVELGVRSIPTIKAFSSGNVVSTKVGILQESQLKELVSEVF
jgi:thioredoxin 1